MYSLSDSCGVLISSADVARLLRMLESPSMRTTPLSRLDAEDVAQTLIAFVNTHIMSRGHPMTADDAFETAGVDSMAFLKLLLFVEAEFGFWMPDDDLVEENVASPRALAKYICRWPSG